MPWPEVTLAARFTHSEGEQFEELHAFEREERRLEEEAKEKQKPLHPGVAAAIIGGFITVACLCSILCGELGVCLEHRRERKRQSQLDAVVKFAKDEAAKCESGDDLEDLQEPAEPAEVAEVIEESKAESASLAVESHENADLRSAAQSSNPQEAAPPPHVEVIQSLTESADVASLATRSSEGADTPRESYEKRVAPQPQPPAGTPPAAPGANKEALKGEANVGQQEQKVPEFSDQPTAPLDSDVLEQWC